MYGFGEEEIEPQGQEAKEPAWFRSRMDKVSGEIAALKEENDRLRAEQAKQSVKEALTAKGYAPEAAGLYSGTPDKLDDWLGTHGAALAKASAEGEQPDGALQGTPQTVVSSESQAQLANFAAAGQGAAGAAASAEAQLVARMNAATSLQELEAIEREQGSRYV
jgi:hypothetical protein